ncbi:MAG: hypothetical protein J07HN6_00418 [Halonotius sp. J07HN6]|nr:MAG: hypothetical protein J07HN6_00418 [Halonotius sp. J07HN6]
MSDEAKSRWYTQERCRRQAMRQDTPAGRALKRQAERAEQNAERREQQSRVQSAQETETSSAESCAP